MRRVDARDGGRLASRRPDQPDSTPRGVAFVMRARGCGASGACSASGAGRSRRTGVRSLARASVAARGARLVELYSGIGATRLALEPLLNLRDVVSVDNSDAANAVYASNFPGHVPKRKNIEHLDLNAFFASDGEDVFLTMSPPCQPYTRRGKRSESEDPRARSFHRIIDSIRSLNHPPRWIFVENVVGFEKSDTRKCLLEALRARGYGGVREFIVSPTALGIPYTRERYYLIATFRQAGFDAPPPRWLDGYELDESGDFIDGDARDWERDRSTLERYVEHEFDEKAELRLRPDTIRKYWKWLDVVTKDSERCSTFTAGYADTVFGGSVYLLDAHRDLTHSLEVDDVSGVMRIEERDVERFVRRCAGSMSKKSKPCTAFAPTFLSPRARRIKSLYFY